MVLDQARVAQLQVEQVPFSTKYAPDTRNPTGACTAGVCMDSIQMVFPHWSQ